MKRKPKRRRIPKAKNENYYKILGIRSNASQEKIKKRYIEKVKAFPPEEYPEEFQHIRRAYETLSNPLKRGEYDVRYKYGGKIDKIMCKAMEYMVIGELDTAAELAQEAAKLAPNNIQIFTFRAHVALLQGDEQTFQEQFQQAEQLMPEKDRLRVFLVKARMLLGEEYAEEALSVLEKAQSLYPEEKDRLKSLYAEVYQELGRDAERWEILQSMIPTVETQTPEDIYIFADWINAMVNLDKWQEKAKIKTRVRKFLKAINDEEDRFMVLAVLRNEYEEYLKVGRFRVAEMFIDFIYYIDKEPGVREELHETQELMRLENEIDRMQKDQNLFPLVVIHAIELFNEYTTPYNDISYLRNGISGNLLAEFEEMDEEFAAGIIRLKKKYPRIYRCFQEEWDEIFKERTAGLNRAARRQLR